jgi:hypothetical protein
MTMQGRQPPPTRRGAGTHGVTPRQAATWARAYACSNYRRQGPPVVIQCLPRTTRVECLSPWDSGPSPSVVIQSGVMQRVLMLRAVVQSAVMQRGAPGVDVESSRAQASASSCTSPVLRGSTKNSSSRRKLSSSCAPAADLRGTSCGCCKGSAGCCKRMVGTGCCRSAGGGQRRRGGSAPCIVQCIICGMVAPSAALTAQ